MNIENDLQSQFNNIDNDKMKMIFKIKKYVSIILFLWGLIKDVFIIYLMIKMI